MLLWFFFSFSAHFSSSEISRQNFLEIITLFFFLNICPTHFEYFLLGHHVFLFLHIQGLGLRSKPSPLGHSHGLWVCLPLPSCTEQRRETKLTFASWCLVSMKTSYFIQIPKKFSSPLSTAVLTPLLNDFILLSNRSTQMFQSLISLFLYSSTEIVDLRRNIVWVTLGNFHHLNFISLY